MMLLKKLAEVLDKDPSELKPTRSITNFSQ